jgi:GAF domain-containing protein/HAMP domain-containing protein
MKWLPKLGLRAKVSLAITITMVIILGLAFWGISQYIRARLWQSEIQKTENINAVAATLLDNAMLAGRKDVVAEALSSLGKNVGGQQLNSIAIYNVKNELSSFASGFPGGTTIHPENMAKSIQDPSCWGCHQFPAGNRPTHLVVNVNGQDVIRNVVPLYNEPRCQTCHGTGAKVLGDSIVDYSQTQFQQAYTNILLGIAGGIILAVILVAFVLYLLMNRIVLNPLEKFVAVTDAVAQGDLSQRVDVNSDDEIGILERAFNKMAAQLSDLIGSLEQRVAAATRNLTIAGEVGRSVAQEHDLDILLNEAVDLIRDRFDLYYAQVYLPDPTGRRLVLRAGTGDVGQQLMSRGHSLAADLTSLNGTAAVEKRSVIVENTETSTIHRPNPLLPDTRSEMVVPLLIGERLVGTVDMQSIQAGALNKENLAAFEALAGQLAIAIENAALLAETEAARDTVEAHSRRLIREGWQDFLNAVERGERIGYTYDLKNVSPITEPVSPDPEGRAMLITIPVQNEPVGVFKLESEQSWTKEDATLVDNIAQQLGRQVENIRLLAQADQYRAEAEQAFRRLTHTGWEAQFAAHPEAEIGFTYDLNTISPLSSAQIDNTLPVETHSLEILGEKIGEISVAGTKSSREEVDELLSTISEQLSARVENLRLFEETSRRNEELASLNEIISSASLSLDMNDILAKMLELVIETMHLDAGLVSLFNVSNNRLELTSSLLLPDKMRTKFVTEGLQGTLCDFVYQNKQVLTVDDLNKDSPVNVSGALAAGFNSYIGVPLEVKGEIIGTLCAFKKSTFSFQKNMVELMRTMGRQIGFAVENARLFEESERSQVEVEKRARQLAAVAEVSTVSSKELDIDNMLRSVVQLTQRQFGLYHAHIFLYDEKIEELKIAACGWKEGDEHAGTHETVSIPINQEQSLVARAAQTRQAVVINDVHNEPGWLPNPLLPDTASELVVPLIIGDQILGVLDVQSDRLNAFSEEDANIQTTLASQVAIAIQNARSFAQAQKQAERETMLNVIGQKIRAATTVDAVLQIAARELGHALGAPLTIAQLGLKDKS